VASKAIHEALNDQQELFCQHYAVTLDAGKAANEANYAPQYAYKLLRKPAIIDRIAEIQRQQGVRMIVTQAKVIRETAYLAYSDITETMGCRSMEDIQKLPENVRKAIKKVKSTRRPVVVDVPVGDQGELTRKQVMYEEIVEIEMHSKTECLKLLAMISGAADPENRNKEQAPAFTGVEMKLLSPGNNGANHVQSADRPIRLSGPTAAKPENPES
jgi:phage terminase small subunit